MTRIRNGRLAVSLSLVLLLSGCGGGMVVSGGSGPTASHGGTLLELPENAGHVELIVEKADAKAAGRRVTGKVVAFFTNPAGNAPLDPAPADVVFTDEEGKKHPLAAKGGDATAARFESEPFPTAAGEPTGTLEASVGGKPVLVQNRPR